MKKTDKISLTIFLFLVFVITSFSAHCQKGSTIYLGKNGKLTTLEHAEIIQKIKKKSEKNTTILLLNKSADGWDKMMTETYRKENDSTLFVRTGSKTEALSWRRIFHLQNDGTYRFKDMTKGRTIREGLSKTLIPLTLHGKSTEYYPSGQIKSISIYENNELVSNENWNEDGSKYIDNLFYSTDVDPIYTPGIGVLRNHLLTDLKNAGVDIVALTGTLTLSFVIMENGKIEGIKILKGLGTNINNVVFQSFLSLPGEWKPARHNDQPVRYCQVFPINFINKTQSLEFAEIRGGILHFGAY
jgi:hypothetical protein